MKAAATCLFLLAALAVPAWGQPVNPAPLRSSPLAGVTGDSGWQIDTLRPDLYAIGMTRTDGALDPEALVIAQRGPAPRIRGRNYTGPGRPSGGVQRTVSAAAFAGKRVRLSARIKTRDAVKVQMTLTARGPGRTLGYDMADRAISGTTDWRRYEIVMDVPRDATELSFGFLVKGGDHMFLPRDGNGVAWADSFRLEDVGKDEEVSRNYLDAGWRRPTTDRGSEPSFYWDNAAYGTDHHTMELQAEAARAPPPPSK